MLGGHSMKIYFVLLISLLFPVLIYAEFEELVQLKKSGQIALKKYAERLSNVDPKFEGVINFGNALQSLNDPDNADVDQLTVVNKDYWRAVIEMIPTDPSIFFAHAYLYVARGETAYSDIYFLLGSLAMSDDFRGDLNEYSRVKAKLDSREANEISKGFPYHDNGEYAKALAAYDEVISQYPNSAWAFYEKGYSYSMMGYLDPDFAMKREKMFATCRQCNPFYYMGYSGSDSLALGSLMVLLEKVKPFVDGKKRDIEGLKSFAEGCEKMRLYSFAAHARWKLVLLDSKENTEDHLRAFLDLLSKCGCKEASFIRDQFKLE